MKRHLSNVLGVASALLCVLIAVAWARSYLGATLLVESTNGKLVLVGLDAPPVDVHLARAGPTSTDAFVGQSGTRPREVRLAGVALYRGRSMYFQTSRAGAPAVFVGSWHVVAVPYAYLLLAAAAPGDVVAPPA